MSGATLTLNASQSVQVATTLSQADGSFLLQGVFTTQKPSIPDFTITARKVSFMTRHQAVSPVAPSLKLELQPVSTISPASMGALSSRVALYPGDRIAAVTMTFDDDKSSQITTVAPLLAEYGYKSTFYLITNGVGDLLDQWGKAWHGTNWDMWKGIAAAGHEIGNHTSNHNLSAAATVEADQFNMAAIMKGYDDIKTIIGTAPITFAFPGGSESDRTRALVNATPHIAYRTSIHGLVGARFYPEGDNLTTDTGVNYIKKAMAHTPIWNGAVPTWFLFYMHDVTPARAVVLRSMLDFIRANDDLVWCDTYGNATIYEREREQSTLSVQKINATSVAISLTNSLDSAIFHAPLTVVLPVANATSAWANRDGAAPVAIKIMKDRLLVDVVPDSKPVYVTWSETATVPVPVVTLSVGATSTSSGSNPALTAPAAVMLTASVSGVTAAVQRLSILNGSQVLAESATQPFSYTWRAIPAGTYLLSATVQTANGLLQSAPVTVTVAAAVNQLPVVQIISPQDNSTFAESAVIPLSASASDTDGAVSAITFYRGTTLIGSCPAATCTINWTSPAAGAYSIVAIATDDLGGSTTSSAIRVTVQGANRPPVVTMTAPSEGTTLVAPATITLTAAANDPDGQVVAGHFSNGVNSLGETSVSPFAFTWSNIPAGTYTITATASDNQGASTTSTPIHIEVRDSGSVPAGVNYSWGVGSSYQLGTGTVDSRTSPGPFQLFPDAPVALHGGSAHSVAVKTDGTVWAWGLNTYGQLGTGTTTVYQLPVQVTGLSGIVAVAAGYHHTIALAQDGKVWAWGYNANGQLGCGNFTNALVPALVSGLSNVVSIASGDYHSLALKSDGTVWAWGSGYNGVLGSGSQTSAPTPKQVPGLVGIKSIAAGGSQSAAIGSDGVVWNWGANSSAQVKLSPVALEISNVREIAMGQNHMLALKDDGTVWAWGAAYNNGGTVATTALQQLTTLTGVASITAGFNASYAVKTDGTVWAWGRNYLGELGIGTAKSTAIPQMLKGMTGITLIRSGRSHVLASGR